MSKFEIAGVNFFRSNTLLANANLAQLYCLCFTDSSQGFEHRLRHPMTCNHTSYRFAQFIPFRVVQDSDFPLVLPFLVLGEQNHLSSFMFIADVIQVEKEI